MPPLKTGCSPNTKLLFLHDGTAIAIFRKLSKLQLLRQNVVDGGCAGSGYQQRQHRHQVKHDELPMIAPWALAEEGEMMDEGPSHKNVPKAVKSGPARP